MEAEKQGHSPDTVSLSGVQEVATMLRGGESVVLHCDTGVQRSGIVAYLALRHCNLNPSEALELLGAQKLLNSQQNILAFAKPCSGQTPGKSIQTRPFVLFPQGTCVPSHG